MRGKGLVCGILFFISMLTGVVPAGASFIIQSQESTNIEIKGYNGLAEIILFTGELDAGVRQRIETSYKGLVLLVFSGRQGYPVILGSETFLLKITNPDTPPSFTGSEENDFFYALLSGRQTGGVDKQYPFALLMLEAKQLLDSTGSMRTVDELQLMKEKFHLFVTNHYADLAHSDLLRRLIAKYFMMHEYVDYHVQGTPVENIKRRYQSAILNGVSNWLDILQPNIPQHEILNYSVLLYYNRSMVSLAFKIISNFREFAYCPGAEVTTIALPPSLRLAGANNRTIALQDLGDRKIVSFVSTDCPVSMVATVNGARRFAQQPDTSLIVVPLQPLSENHLAMRKMVSGGNLLFVDDETWRKDYLTTKIKLPFWVELGKHPAYSGF